MLQRHHECLRWEHGSKRQEPTSRQDVGNSNQIFGVTDRTRSRLGAMIGETAGRFLFMDPTKRGARGRPVALGRKNWLHVGSAQSGPKVAAILSVVESCRRLSVPVKDYLLAVLPGMSQRTLSQLAPFTPARWAASRS